MVVRDGSEAEWFAYRGYGDIGVSVGTLVWWQVGAELFYEGLGVSCGLISW